MIKIHLIHFWKRLVKSLYESDFFSSYFTCFTDLLSEQSKFVVKQIFVRYTFLDNSVKLLISCVCVCVCVCVFIFFYREGFFRMQEDSKTYLRGTDQRSCVVNIYLGASAKFLHFYFRTILLHLQSRNSSPPKKTGEKTV